MTAPILSLPVKVLRSATAGRRPGDGTFRALADGEVFVNTQDRVLCFLDASGTLVAFPIDPAVLAALAPLASPILTGSPKAPTAAAGDSSTQLATTAFVAAAVAAILAQIEGGAPGALSTLKELADAINDDAGFAATTASALANRLRLDANQANGLPAKALGRFNLGAAPYEALARDNLAINPRHVYSQINGNSAVTAAGYVTDQNCVYGNLGFSAARVVSPFTTRPDIPYGLRVTVGTARATLASGDYLQLYQPIEGLRAKKLLFGSAAAFGVAVGFMAKSSVAGTFYFSLRNNAVNRSFAQRFTLAANTEVFVTLAIPGDTAGTWTVDTSIGVHVSVALAAGSNNQGPAASWQTSGFIAASDQTNLFATAGATFVMSDLIMLPISAVPADLSTLFPTDRLPLFQRPDLEELALCQRYWRQDNLVSAGFRTGNDANGLLRAAFALPVPMRVAPAVAAVLNSGFADGENGSVYWPANWTTSRAFAGSFTGTGAYASGTGSTLNVPASVGATFNSDARM